MKIVGATGLGRLWAWHIRVINFTLYCTLRRRLRNLNLRSHFSIFDTFRDIRVHTYDFLKFVGGMWALKWAWQTFFWVNR